MGHCLAGHRDSSLLGEGSEIFCKCGEMTALVSKLVSLVSAISVRVRWGKSSNCYEENVCWKMKKSRNLTKPLESSRQVYFFFFIYEKNNIQDQLISFQWLFLEFRILDLFFFLFCSSVLICLGVMFCLLQAHFALNRMFPPCLICQKCHVLI